MKKFLLTLLAAAAALSVRAGIQLAKDGTTEYTIIYKFYTLFSYISISSNKLIH